MRLKQSKMKEETIEKINTVILYSLVGIGITWTLLTIAGAMSIMLNVN